MYIYQHYSHYLLYELGRATSFSDWRSEHDEHDVYNDPRHQENNMVDESNTSDCAMKLSHLLLILCHVVNPSLQDMAT